MKNRFLLLIFLVVPLLLTAAPAYAGKQAICHFPPGNPDNWHTIMVSDNAVASHLENHGDIMGSCAESCETLCDDGNFCTQDVFSVADGDCVCNSGERPAVECDDGNECTEDSRPVRTRLVPAGVRPGPVPYPHTLYTSPPPQPL